MSGSALLPRFTSLGESHKLDSSTAIKRSVAHNNHEYTYILTTTTTPIHELPELHGLSPESAYTIQFVTTSGSAEPYILIGEQTPDKSLQDHPVWDFIGGKVNPGEATFAAAIRERLEETGLMPDMAPYSNDVLYVVFNENGAKHVKAFFFATINLDTILDPETITKCRNNISIAGHGRFELIRFGLVSLFDFIDMTLKHDALTEEKIYAIKPNLTELKHAHKHPHRHAWRKHVLEFLGNTEAALLLTKIVMQMNASQHQAAPRLR